MGTNHLNITLLPIGTPRPMALTTYGRALPHLRSDNADHQTSFTCAPC